MSNAFIEDAKSVSFPCLKVTQPIGDFFVGVIGYKILREISHFDVRRVLRDDRDVERYLGIQRPLNAARVKDLEKYVRFYDATFPTAIIVAVEADAASFSESRHEMTLSNVIRDTRENSILFRQIARVLDGQHRIDGLSDYQGPDFDLNVTVFVGIDIAQQAQIFATVNLEQTKVNRSLAIDLFELSSSRSPQKTCHNVVVALDQDPTSPFYHRIKRLGTTTDGRIGETLTQATFVESLIKLISRDPPKDRDDILRKRAPLRASEAELQMLPFRNLFMDGKDIVIAKIIWNYFEAVSQHWSIAWKSSNRGYILNRTNGFRALMRVFKPIYLQIAHPGDVIEFRVYKAQFEKLTLTDEDFHTENFPPGSSGEANLVRQISQELELGRV